MEQLTGFAAGHVAGTAFVPPALDPEPEPELDPLEPEPSPPELEPLAPEPEPSPPEPELPEGSAPDGGPPPMI